MKASRVKINPKGSRRRAMSGAHVGAIVQRGMKATALWGKVRRCRTQAQTAYNKGDIARSNAYSRQADALAERLTRSGLDTPVGKLPNPAPNEWDDETLNEAARLGSTQARALGKAERASRSGPRFFNVTWFSPTRQKRVGFIRPIEATSAADAKRQAKAMITNEKAVNIVAKEARGNPKRPWPLEQGTLKYRPRRKTVPVVKVKGYQYCPSCDARAISDEDGSRGTCLKCGRYSTPWEREAYYKQRKRNPGIMEIAGGLQALDYLGEKVGVGKRKRNPIPPKLAKRLGDFVTQRQRPDCELCGKRKVTRMGYGKKLVCETCWKEQKETRRINPSVNEMSERFQGRATGKTEDYYFSDSAPRLDMSRGGKLVFLKLKSTTIRVPASVVAIDPKLEKLWLGTKRAAGMFKLPERLSKGETVSYGDVDEICYLTAKAHIGGGKPFEYHHTFGEDGGRKPRLLIDHEGMPILQGGDYKIEDRGIVN